MSDVWKESREALKLQMTKATYDSLIEPIRFVSELNSIYTLGIISASVKERLENMPIGQAVNRAIVDITGGPVTVEYVIIDGESPPSRGKAKKLIHPPDDEDLPGSVRDKRKPGRYYIDNRFIRGGYAARVGPGGIAVYNILAASADNDYQDCFPSYGKIAELGGMSKTQAKNKIKELEALNIVSVERRKNPSNPKINDSNLFTLIDDKEWKKLKQEG